MKDFDSAPYVAWCEAFLRSLSTRPIARWYWPQNRRRDAVLRYAARRIPAGPVLEFGVFRGVSLRMQSRRQPARQFFGFDSFEGFPDDARSDWQQDFSVVSLPDMPGNVTLIKGWFAETLPAFIAQHPEPPAMIHIDCDIYSSTAEVLSALSDAGWLRAGLMVVMDEAINYNQFAWNEALALWQVLDRVGLGIEPVAVHDKVRTLADTLRLLEAGKHRSWRDDQALGYRQQAAFRLTGVPLAVAEPDPATVAAFDRLTASRSP